MTKTASATTQYVFDVHRERCRTIVAAPCRGRSVDLVAVVMLGTVSCYSREWQGAECCCMTVMEVLNVHSVRCISFLHDVTVPYVRFWYKILLKWGGGPRLIDLVEALSALHVPWSILY